MSDTARTILAIVEQHPDLQRAYGQHVHFHAIIGLCRRHLESSDAEFLIDLTRHLAAQAADFHHAIDRLTEHARTTPSPPIIAAAEGNATGP